VLHGDILGDGDVAPVRHLDLTYNVGDGKKRCLALKVVHKLRCRIGSNVLIWTIHNTLVARLLEGLGLSCG
jgi:hypothetical protein